MTVDEIGVVVSKSVRIDRDGARSLLRAYSDWANANAFKEKDLLHQDDVDTFLARYATLPPELTNG